ncbi:MAG: extracellular solute-binding protein [Armatimonadota bacterium]
MTKLVLRTREQDTFENALAWQIEDFRKVRPDIEIEVVAKPISAHQHEMVVEEGAKNGEGDLFLCCTDWLPEAFAKGLIVPLDGFELPADWPDGWHPAMQKLVYQGGSLIGIPWHDGPQMFIYLKHIFEDPGHIAQFEARYGWRLDVPKTWEQFRQVAEFFTHPENDEWGCICAGYTDGHNNVYDFLIQLWSRGGVLLDDEFRPCFDGPEGVAGLTFLRDLYRDCMPPAALNLGSVEAGDSFAKGNVAMMWNWCGFAAVCEMPEYSNVVGKVGLASLPGGPESVSLNIYWAMTITSGCVDKEAAWAFMRHISKADCDKVTSMVGANGTRLSTWRDPEVRAKYPHYKIIEEVHGQTRTLPAIPEYTMVNDNISTAVHAVIHLGADPRLALEASRCEAEYFLEQSGRLRRN